MTNEEYDVVIVLCGGLRRTGTGYAPTTFQDGDEFGMLGAAVRVTAAEELYWQGKAQNFMFSTGVSAKQVEKFGPDVPPESHVYRDVFLRELRADNRYAAGAALPDVYVEDVSVNTVANLYESVAICQEKTWERVAIVSSEYHIPRITMLFAMIARREDWSLRPDFLEAELIVRQARPGVYDAEIDAAYASDAAKLRIANEQRGCSHIGSGEYVLGEYQPAGKAA